MLGRRPDGRGQSLLEWIGYSVMAVFYSIVSIVFAEPVRPSFLFLTILRPSNASAIVPSY